MAKKRDKKIKLKESKAEEPAPVYKTSQSKGKELVFFKSFQEMNDYDHKEMAAFTPIERLQHITESLKYTYAEELKKKMSLTIHFK